MSFGNNIWSLRGGRGGKMTLRLLRKKRRVPEEKGDQQLINLSVMKIHKITEFDKK